MHNIAKQLSVAEDQLNEAFQERRDVIRATMLAILCAQHVFILGLPGEAKSMLFRVVVSIFRSASYFEVAFSKRRSIEQVIGPVDLIKLREEGKQVHHREGYATTVDLAGFDELGKMSDIVGHDMLLLLNERKIHEVREDGSIHDAPLSTAFCPSNELLTGQSDDAAALDDRLLLRTQVHPIVERANFVKMLTSGPPQVDVKIDWAEVKQVITEVVPAIPVSDAAIAALVDLRYDKFPAAGYTISGRRWKQCVRVLQASAFLHGREEADVTDIEALQYVLWMTPDQIDKVTRICLVACNPFASRIFDIRDVIDGVVEELGHRELLDPTDHNRQAYGTDANRKLDDVRGRLDLILMEAAGAPVPMFKAVSDYHKATLIRMYTGILDQPLEVAETMCIIDQLGEGDGGNR